MDRYSEITKASYENTPSYEDDSYRMGFVRGCQWADEHPNGFINKSKMTITNKEMVEILSRYPQDACVCIEYCNPYRMMFDEKNNIIKID